MHIKLLGKLALLAGVLSGGCSSGSDPQPATGSGTTVPPIAVQVSEAGAPGYSLQEARVVNSNYQSGASSLTITGKLNSGKLLTLTFTRNGTAAANTTNQLEATLDSETGTSPTGTTTYSSTTRTVDGSFRATFSGPGVVSGSFSKVSL